MFRTTCRWDPGTTCHLARSDPDVVDLMPRTELYGAEPMDPVSDQTVDATARSSITRAGYVLTSLPFVLAVALNVLAPGFLDPLFASPPSIAGLPAGVVFLFLTIVWAVLGILVARKARSEARIALALVVFTLPAMFAILVGPALILIIQNLAA
jgi:hypothetical protein